QPALLILFARLIPLGLLGSMVDKANFTSHEFLQLDTFLRWGGAPMKSPNEFWLCVHRLSEAYEAEGLTPDERAENIVDQFRQMPVIAQRHVINELVQLTAHLPDLYPVVVGAMHKQEPAAKKADQV